MTRTRTHALTYFHAYPPVHREFPPSPDIHLDTDAASVHDAVSVIIAALTRAGYIRPDAVSPSAGAGLLVVNGSAAVAAASDAAAAYLDSAPLSGEERALVAALAVGAAGGSPATALQPHVPAASPWLAALLRDAALPSAPGGNSAHAVFLTSIAGGTGGADAAALLTCRVDWDAMLVTLNPHASAAGGAVGGRRVLASTGNAVHGQRRIAVAPGAIASAGKSAAPAGRRNPAVGRGVAAHSAAAASGAAQNGPAQALVHATAIPAAAAAAAAAGHPTLRGVLGAPAAPTPAASGVFGPAPFSAGISAASIPIATGSASTVTPLLTPLSPHPTVSEVVTALSNAEFARAQSLLSAQLAATGVCLLAQPLIEPKLKVRTRKASATSASPFGGPATEGAVSGRLYGGLPTSGSPSARSLEFAMSHLRDPLSGTMRSPPAEVLLVLTLGPQGPTTLALKEVLPGLSVFGANVERLYYAEAFAAASNADPPESTSLLSGQGALPVPPAVVPIFAESLRPGQSPFVDRYWRSSLPSSWGLSPAAATAVAWDVWTGLRWAINSAEALTAVVSPRLLPYAEHILLLDPCLRVLIVIPEDSDAVTATKAAIASNYGTGSDGFVDEWITASEHLAKEHVGRILTVRTHGPALSLNSGEATNVRAWLRRHPVDVL